MYVNHEVFNDADRHAAALQGWDQRYDQIGAGAFQSTVKQVAVDGVQVFQEAANVRVVQRGGLPAGYTTFGLALNGSAPFTFRGVKLEQGAMVVASGAKEFTLHSPADMSLVGIAIAPHVLGMVADAAGLDMDNGLFDRDVIDIPPAAGIRVGRRMVEALERVLAQPERIADHEGQRRFAQEVAEGILDLITYHFPDQTSRLTQACQHEIVWRSHELVLARPEEPVSVLDLCAALRVSRRTIQNSFQAVAQTNPANYLRSIRLMEVRRLLLSTPQRDVPVAEAAARWGFTHLGHFASDYRNQFGELPSQTARRS
ncbi:AraC family transcriptional regulator [Caballeronia arationis]|uniref:Helix-turn-helix domain-containing protein n=1 Tax=Caballeronia arationis TaxID=1777142 RepID=A0A7Z7N4X1_9BURK|nr:helix-turn-helix domain-containing protein [Caballeronia arationis]SAK76583.1 AraC family transcriptional regulator [Caballeronia arationis]SOE81628.1 Helix-turn-helix domain-containing protein [Caballeronia arationis]